MNNIDLYELVERYLLHRTNPEETAEIERRIEKDPSFASEVQLHRNMQQLITDNSLLNIKRELKQIRAKKISEIKSRKRLYRNILIGSSGIVILTISSLLLFNKKDIAVRPAPEASETSGAFKDTSVFLYGQTDTNMVELRKESEKTGITPTISNIKDTIYDKNKTAIYYPVKGSPEYTETESAEKMEIKGKDTFTDFQVIYPGDTKSIQQEKLVGLPCDLTAEYMTQPSCNNKATGLIQFTEGSVSGGVPPYQFAINGRFSDSMVYRNLPPGIYNIAVRDAFNCIKEWEIVKIEEINCFGEFKFAPLYGESWEIPIEAGKPGVLTITDKSGLIVYTIKFDGFSKLSWNGKSINNEMLPMGAYPFIISYYNGNVFLGSVTIVK